MVLPSPGEYTALDFAPVLCSTVSLALLHCFRAWHYSHPELLLPCLALLLPLGTHV